MTDYTQTADRYERKVECLRQDSSFELKNHALNHVCGASEWVEDVNESGDTSQGEYTL